MSLTARGSMVTFVCASVGEIDGERLGESDGNILGWSEGMSLS